ncbi:thiolase family protein [Streptomyces sp. DSM 41033]|uniref:thiolase family protein n=1 Tax=Streptomyces sp. DSM 41033 TaxID=3448655 RepID=UPI004040191C
MSFRPRDVYIVDAVRTPIGRYNGALAQVRPDDLAAHTLRALLERTPELDPSRIGDVVLGNANGAGEENRNVGRMAALLAGLPVSVPGVTVNRLCASGLEAVVQAARAVALGDHSLVIAGGVESMTRAPYVLPKSDRAFPAGHPEMYSTTLGWRMVNPRMDPRWTVPLGESAELIAEKPLARITASAVSANEPHYFGLAPVEAVNRALDRAGRSFADLAALELNEAFAAQVLGCLAEWPDLDPTVLNPRGGAIAIGHPLGASGARLAGSIAHQLKAAGSGVGVATLCIGVGQGSALVLER